MVSAKILGEIFNAAAYLVFICSLLSLFLAVIERWANQWFPKSKFAFAVTASNDLISKFGALNLRDHIAPRQWDGADRRSAPNDSGEK